MEGFLLILALAGVLFGVLFIVYGVSWIVQIWDESAKEDKVKNFSDKFISSLAYLLVIYLWIRLSFWVVTKILEFFFS